MRTIFPADADLIEKIPPVLVGAGRRRSQDLGDLSRRERAPAGLPPVAGATVPGGRHAAAEWRAAAPSPERDKEAHAPRGEERQFVVFRLGDDEFGLPIEAVDEVARVPDQITRLPKTPKFLEGVVNLRGEVLPVVDQRRRFDMPALEERGGAPPGRRPDRASQRRPHRRFGLGSPALRGRRHRAGAQPHQRGRHAWSTA